MKRLWNQMKSQKIHNKIQRIQEILNLGPGNHPHAWGPWPWRKTACSKCACLEACGLGSWRLQSCWLMNFDDFVWFHACVSWEFQTILHDLTWFQMSFFVLAAGEPPSYWVSSIPKHASIDGLYSLGSCPTVRQPGNWSLDFLPCCSQHDNTSCC